MTSTQRGRGKAGRWFGRFGGQTSRLHNPPQSTIDRKEPSTTNQIMDLFPVEAITGEQIPNRFEPEEVETSKQPRALPEPPPPPPQWVLDLHSPPKPRTKATIPDPPGYSASLSGKARASLTQKNSPTQPANNNSPSSQRSAASKAQLLKVPTPDETDTLKIKKSWELALAPAKALPMNAVMMYMSGNSLQIFSIMMVFMLFKNPIQGLLQTNTVFTRYETEGTRKTLWMAKAMYVAMNLLALGLGIWKVNGMGLLP